MILACPNSKETRYTPRLIDGSRQGPDYLRKYEVTMCFRATGFEKLEVSQFSALPVEDIRVQSPGKKKGGLLATSLGGCEGEWAERASRLSDLGGDNEGEIYHRQVSPRTPLALDKTWERMSHWIYDSNQSGNRR